MTGAWAGMELSPKIRQFIHEEVVRQGWEPKTAAHRARCKWMREAWEWAREAAKDGTPPMHSDVLFLGFLIERDVNRDGIRRFEVRVGDWKAPLADRVGVLLAAWVAALPTLSPDEAYKAFEEIHPFGDGNGRTGKIIHNWLNGTLDDPVLVQDFFGHGVP